MPPHSIVHVITGLGTGGAEMMLSRLLTVTDRDRWRPVVISLQDRGALGERIAALDVPVVSLGMRSAWQTPTALWSLRNKLQAVEPSIVQGWMYHGNVAALIGRTLMRDGGRVPVLWNIRYTPAGLELEKRATAAVIKWGARLSSRAARIIYNSHAGAARHAQLGYAQAGTEIIPNGLDLERFAPSAAARSEWRTRLGASEGTILIGRIGRYHAMKDYPTFLRAAARLVRERPAVRFVAAGEGVDDSNQALLTLINEMGLAAHLRLLGDVRDVHELNAALDIACSSSAYGEGFPTVLGEAMACGVPCIATDVGDSARILGETGRVVAPGDPVALADACRGLIDAGFEERRRLGGVARDRISKEFTLGAIAAKYDALYGALLASDPNARRGSR